MRIALINENSQGAKNGMIYNSLKKVADQYGFEVDNYGMYTAEDEAQLTYVQVGILAAALLNAKAADYVITGCGTGEGAMLACNSFPGVMRWTPIHLPRLTTGTPLPFHLPRDLAGAAI